jgi:5'-deoxynucleotidase YfbR-like HD superfamily hydrolase
MLAFTKEQVKEIAEQLDCGFRAFYHKQSDELVFVPDMDKYFDIDKTAWKEEFAKLRKRSAFQEIEAMKSSDSFNVMEDFAEQVNDTKLQEKLFNALNRKHPFREFKFVIDNSGEYRNTWFDFKNKRYLEWVENQLKAHSNL